MINPVLESYSKQELIELIELYSKNWLAMDGAWLQSVERKFGLDEAMEHSRNAWEKYTTIEAQRIKTFLRLPDNSGVEGLKQALQLRLYANINRDEIIIEDNTLTYKTVDCWVKNAVKRKDIDFHPCDNVGIIEFSGFAKEIDSRFKCQALNGNPDTIDNTCHCAWLFILEE